jgi:hypothetical protein
MKLNRYSYRFTGRFLLADKFAHFTIFIKKATGGKHFFAPLAFILHISSHFFSLVNKPNDKDDSNYTPRSCCSSGCCPRFA